MQLVAVGIHVLYGPLLEIGFVERLPAPQRDVDLLLADQVPRPVLVEGGRAARRRALLADRRDNARRPAVVEDHSPLDVFRQHSVILPRSALSWKDWGPASRPAEGRRHFRASAETAPLSRCSQEIYVDQISIDSMCRAAIIPARGKFGKPGRYGGGCRMQKCWVVNDLRTQRAKG